MRLIGICGKKRSGKDTAFEILRRIGGRSRIYRSAFADPLKREVVRALRSVGSQVELSDIEADKERFRVLLQWWGTEFRRAYFGGDYWLRRMDESIQFTRADALVVTDVRFQNESDFVNSRGGIVIRILREVPAAESRPRGVVDLSQVSSTNLWVIRREIVRCIRNMGWGGSLDGIEGDEARFKPLMEWWAGEFGARLFGGEVHLPLIERSPVHSSENVEAIEGIAHTVDNNGDLDDLRRELVAVWEKIQSSQPNLQTA